MLAAEIWHWWIGVILLGVGVLTVIGLLVNYARAVEAQRFPGRRQQTDD